jgi:hypothetical protein
MRYTSSRESIVDRMLDAFGAVEGERLLDVLARLAPSEVRTVAEQLRREFQATEVDEIGAGECDSPLMIIDAGADC